MRWPLRYQILLPFAGLTIGSIVAVSTLNAVLAARRIDRQVTEQLADISQTIETANFPLNEQVLRQLRGLSGAEYVLASGSSRQVVAASQSPPRIAPAEIADDATSQFDFARAIEVEGDSYFHAAVPVRSASSQPIVLHVFYPEQRWRESRWQAALPPLVVGTVALGLVSAVSVLLSRRLSRPIHNLREQVLRLASDDFRPIVRPERNDELRDLVDSVNSLATRLSESLEVIKKTERWMLLGQLSSGLAHELRNAATGARLAIQLHSRRCKADDRESLDVALRQLEVTETQLRRLLSAGGKSVTQRGKVDLRQLFDNVLMLFDPICRHRNVPCDVTVEPDLALVGDAEQLQQMLMNLLLNALDAVGREGWIRASAIAADEMIQIRISDSGQGPPADLAERIFEPFVSGKPEGIGLGLVVAQQIARSHGGTIHLLAERPTCFEVRLPLVAAVMDTSAPTSELVGSL